MVTHTSPSHTDRRYHHEDRHGPRPSLRRHEIADEQRRRGSARGGALADRWAVKRRDGRLLIAAICTALAAPLMLLALMRPAQDVVLFVVFGSLACMVMYLLCLLLTLVIFAATRTLGRDMDRLRAGIEGEA